MIDALPLYLRGFIIVVDIKANLDLIIAKLLPSPTPSPSLYSPLSLSLL